MAGILSIMVLSVPLAVTAEEIIWGNRAVNQPMQNGDGALNMENQNGVRYNGNSGAQGQQQGASQQNPLVAAVEKYLKGLQLPQLPKLNVNLPNSPQLNRLPMGLNQGQSEEKEECYRVDQVEKIEELFLDLSDYHEERMGDGISEKDGWLDAMDPLKSQVNDAIYTESDDNGAPCDPQLAQLIQKLEGLFAAASQSESG